MVIGQLRAQAGRFGRVSAKSATIAALINLPAIA